ncbi:ATP-binding protein [Pseudocolwellia agarivorans]|uniref:ATP-binding protein n=1 Tax=Pseudocolwellia agarivorans TaxID=1911682 RepID=UPI003F881D04
MIKLPSLSLFTRLYLTIIVAVVFSGTISFFLLEKLKIQTAVADYVFFTDHIYHNLLEQKKVVLDSDLKELNEDMHDIKDMMMSWQIKLSPPPYGDSILLGSARDVEVYMNTSEQYLAIYKYPNLDAWLVISENNLFSFDEDEDFEHKEPLEDTFFSQYSFHDYTEVTLLLAILLSVVGGIYWPIKIIQNQIESLIETQQEFGKGNMRVRAHDDFSKPLNELADSFNSMANSITDTVNENQIFAQAVPHEVRTPLSRIQLAVGLLSRNNHDKQQLELLGNIDTYIDDMSELIRQVVAFSKLNTVQNESESSLETDITLSPFIESRLGLLKCEEKCEITRHIDHTLVIKTNPAYLRLLLDNLIKNASIHAKSHIIISLSQHDNYVELIIEDDGAGIPGEHLETIFIPFARLDQSRNRKTGGLGLGLSIASAACKRMNSQLTVENRAAGGAKFICRFNIV